jgi:hypothetical protein
MNVTEGMSPGQRLAKAHKKASADNVRMTLALIEILKHAEEGAACTDAQIWPQIVRLCKGGLDE